MLNDPELQYNSSELFNRGLNTTICLHPGSEFLINENRDGAGQDLIFDDLTSSDEPWELLFAV